MEKEKNESRSAAYCSPETMRRYPEALRGMPYCVWKYEEDAGGRPTKIPYNPRTGFRAAVDRAYSFADLDTARLSALFGYPAEDLSRLEYEIHSWSGQYDVPLRQA